LRNLFDQYGQIENRLTHALLSALHRDRNLLAQFLVRFAPPLAPAATAIDTSLTKC
jgi:hypothetical protein